MEMIRVWYDGACEPRNPGGHASCGVIIKREERSCSRNPVISGLDRYAQTTLPSILE